MQYCEVRTSGYAFSQGTSADCIDFRRILLGSLPEVTWRKVAPDALED
jgi:hypothetical protein